jgi:hypothetical protein
MIMNESNDIYVTDNGENINNQYQYQYQYQSNEYCLIDILMTVLSVLSHILMITITITITITDI